MPYGQGSEKKGRTSGREGMAPPAFCVKQIRLRLLIMPLLNAQPPHLRPNQGY